MNKLILFTLSIITFFIGIIFFSFQKEWIILRFPGRSLPLIENRKIEKKNIKLFYWHDDKWNYEINDLIWTDNIQENIYKIVYEWLKLLNEEKIINNVSLQNVLISKQEAFISFNKSILKEESSTYEKLMIIESLLKTIRENETQIQKITFLIKNQEFNDSQLNFSNSFNINGFLK